MPDPIRIDHALARVLDAIKPAPPEHWVQFRVTGPHDLMEEVTLSLRDPRIQLQDETDLRYLRAQLRAIRVAKGRHGVEHWKLYRFNAEAIACSDSVALEQARGRTPAITGGR
jgi:hypothetical protein